MDPDDGVLLDIVWRAHEDGNILQVAEPSNRRSETLYGAVTGAKNLIGCHSSSTHAAARTATLISENPPSARPAYSPRLYFRFRCRRCLDFDLCTLSLTSFNIRSQQ